MEFSEVHQEYRNITHVRDVLDRRCLLGWSSLGDAAGLTSLAHTEGGAHEAHPNVVDGGGADDGDAGLERRACGCPGTEFYYPLHSSWRNSCLALRHISVFRAAVL